MSLRNRLTLRSEFKRLHAPFESTNDHFVERRLEDAVLAGLTGVSLFILLFVPRGLQTTETIGTNTPQRIELPLPGQSAVPKSLLADEFTEWSHSRSDAFSRGEWG
jgi:hypothetical protein